MDRATQLPFTDKEICLINCCHLYLQVCTLSDICNAPGTQILNSILRGNRSLTQSSSCLHKATAQPRPCETVWRIWRRFLQLFCDWKTDVLLCFYRLGNWIIHPLHSARFWPFYYSRKTSTLFQAFQMKWYSPHCITFHTYKCKGIVFPFHITTECLVTNCLPSDAIPVDVIVRETGWSIHLDNDVSLVLQTKSLNFSSFKSYIASHSPYIPQLFSPDVFQQIFFCDPVNIFHMLLDSTTTLHLATDGGALP